MQKYKNTKARMLLCSSTNVKQPNNAIHKRTIKLTIKQTRTNNYFKSRKEKGNNFMRYYLRYSAPTIER